MFARDRDHWLFKFSPGEWIRAATGELRRAEEAYARHDAKAGLAGARRAAGMALNGALIVAPNEAWGRSYVEHLIALKEDEGVPEAVRRACATLMAAPPPGGPLVMLRTKEGDARVLEAARDVVAHAYAVVVKSDAHAEDA